MPRDVAVFSPPPLPFHPAVTPLLGRSAAVFAAHGMPVRLRVVPPPVLPAADAVLADPDDPAVLLRLSFRAGTGEGAVLLPAGPVAILLRAVDPAPNGSHPPATVALLLEYALADALAAIETLSGSPLEIVSVREEPPGLPEPAAAGAVVPPVAVGLALEFGGGSVTAILWPPPALFASLCRVLPARLPPDPPVPVPPALCCVRIGVARLPVSVARSLLPGDAVIPDTLLFPAGALLVVGERLVARGRLDGTRLWLDNPLSPAAAEWGDWIVANGDEAVGAIAPEELGLGELQVTLVFELGRRTLPMREVTALGAGHVIELGPVEGASVSVLANGARLGQGELVRVGDALGVRLTRIAAAQAAP